LICGLTVVEFEHFWVEDSHCVACRCSMATFAFFTNLGFWEGLHFARIRSYRRWMKIVFLMLSGFFWLAFKFNYINHVSGLQEFQEDSGCFLHDELHRSQVIAASCYAQTGVTSTTVDVDLHSKQALRGISPGARGRREVCDWWLARWSKSGFSGFVLTEVNSEQPAKSSHVEPVEQTQTRWCPFGYMGVVLNPLEANLVEALLWWFCRAKTHDFSREGARRRKGERKVV
jgi:hypothetical protein